jgi:hypothetical protein
MDQAWRLSPLRQGVHHPYGSAAAGGVRERGWCLKVMEDGVVLREVGTWGPALCLWGAARLLFPARSHLGMLRHDWEGAPANGAQPSGRCNTSRSQSLQFWVFSPLALRSGPAPRHFVGGRGGLHFADRTRS